MSLLTNPVSTQRVIDTDIVIEAYQHLLDRVLSKVEWSSEVKQRII